MKTLILLLIFSSSLVAQENSIIIGMTKIRLGESKSEIEKSYQGNKYFSVKSNNDAITFFNNITYIGYATLKNDTVYSITKIWTNRTTGYNVSKEFDMLFNLLSKYNDKLYTAIIQLQNIQEPNINYKAIYIDIGQYRRITIDKSGISETLAIY